MKNLTKQKEIFVAEYIKSLDAELSAKNAGYEENEIKFVTEVLLYDNLIIQEIKYQLKKQINSLKVHKGYVVQKFLEIAEFSLEEEEILDKEGGYTGRKKLRDAVVGLRALEYLCKYLGFSSKPDDESMPETKIITINNLDDEKI
jgi:phage terminase small subunit